MPDVNDPDIDPQSGVLNNKLNIKNQAALDKAERRITFEQLQKLEQSPLPGLYDLTHYKAFHHYIFDAIFPFAGKERTIKTFKGEKVLQGSSVDYARPEMIKPYAEHSLKLLRSVNFNQSLKKTSKELAHAMTELWTAHPFREGNTRTTIAFISQFANDNDFKLDPQSLYQKKNNNLSLRDRLAKASMTRDSEPLVNMIIGARKSAATRDTKIIKSLLKGLNKVYENKNVTADNVKQAKAKATAILKENSISLSHYKTVTREILTKQQQRHQRVAQDQGAELER